jgi:hypothetical protein
MPAIIIAPAAAAATASTATTRISAETLASARPVSLGLGFVHVQGTTAQFGAIQGRYGLFGLARVWHFYECKSARASSFAVSDDVYIFNRTVRRK